MATQAKAAPPGLPALLAQAWRVSPAATAERWSRGQWRRAPHLDYLSRLLEDGIWAGNARILVSLPPRHGKSEIVSHWTPVWSLANWPERKVILASYEADFAASWGRRVRDTANSLPELGVRLRPDTQAANLWQTVQGGGMVTAGVGGPITGRGADLLIVDDPLKNMEEATSPTIRERIWEWWQTTALTRLEPRASVVILMTRWHPDDLVGKLTTQPGRERWTVVNMPALALAGDVLGRVEGEALWPERYPVGVLVGIRRDVGEDAWASMYQQRPNPLGLGYFFDHESIHGMEVDCREPSEVRDGNLVRIWQKPVVAGRYVGFGDVAWGEKGAYSCFVLADWQTGAQVAEIYGRPEADENASQIAKLTKEYNRAFFSIEVNGEGRDVVNKLIALGLGDRMYHHGERWRDDERQRGWLTDRNTRPTMLTEWAEAIRGRGVVIRCKDALSEHLTFVRDEKGHPGPQGGCHGDHVMAWAGLWKMRGYAKYNVAGRVATASYAW